MIVFDKLWILLDKKDLKQQYLINNGIHRTTIYKLKNNEIVNTETLNNLCKILDCKLNDICEYIKE